MSRISMPNTNEPGFVDAHVHIRNSDAFSQLANAGIVAARDAGTIDSIGLSARASSKMVTIISAGRALYKKGGYGSLFGVPVETRGEIKAEILRLTQAGADIIKVMASGMVSLKNPGTVTPGGFDANELRFVVEEAAQVDLPVMAHANGEAAIIAAAEAGVRSIEHGFFMTPTALASMAKQTVYWVPTVGALVRSSEKTGVSAETGTFVEKLTRDHLAMIAQARAMNVPLAIGTDAVLPDPFYAEYYKEEIEWFVQAGIGRGEAEAIACKGGMELLTAGLRHK